MAYNNRVQQLWLTLKSIRKQFCKDVEVIVVDDGSDVDQLASKVVSNFKDMEIKTTLLQKEKKTWVNPCIPFNIGLREAKGDIIIIQSPECIHIGDVLGYVRRSLTSKNYLTFSCYSTSRHEHSKLGVLINTPDSLLEKEVLKIVSLFKSNGSANHASEDCWFNHPTFCPNQYHFLSAITRENLQDLGGFDERYGTGYCWDDNEFLWRVKQKGLCVQIVAPEHGFAIHQWHEKGALRGTCPEWYKNKAMFEEITKKSPTYHVSYL